MTLTISFTFPEICMPLPTPEIGKEKAKAISQMKHLRGNLITGGITPEFTQNVRINNRQTHLGFS